MSLDNRFQKVADEIRRLKTKPDDEDLLEIYGLYKQATMGDINRDRSLLSIEDLKGRAKWEAWHLMKGIKQDEAKEQYIYKAQKLIEEIGLK
ncbi:unnamed protein product [Psylliodes chrysocephalus]|uniref:ACB domain-containing protein n=1 Tax=Psylliodes chrysocephalus TaxID=3402493 RepID=A0A9P0D8F3_9CUCU|nr:unnamed protein product [Psylliodes chrysocephala]